MVDTEIIKIAFLKELEKNAAWEETAAKLLSKFFTGAEKITGGKYSKFLGEAGKGFLDSKGAYSLKHGAEYLKKFETPEFIKTKNGITKAIRVTPKNDNFVAKSIANTMRNNKTLFSGYSKDKGILGNIGQGVKNFSKDSVQSLRDASYKEMKPDKYTSILKKRGLFGKEKTYIKTRYGTKRAVKGISEANNPIIRKRPIPLALAATVTPAGMAATSLIGSGSKKEKTKNALLEYGAWKTPIGPLKLLYDMPKMVGDLVPKN